MTDESRSISSEERDCTGAPEAEPCSSAEKKGLLVVGIYKLLEALFFVAVGAGALHLVHKNIGDVIMRAVNVLPMDPDGRLVTYLMDKAHLVNAHDLRRIGGGAFAYAATRMIEGTGLLLRKTWAEYFTVFLTALGLPVEVYELVKHVNWFKVGALVANAVILVYLIWVLKRGRGRSMRAAVRG